MQKCFWLVLTEKKGICWYPEEEMKDKKMRGMDEGLTFSQACELALSALAEVQVRSPGCFANGSVRLWIEVVLSKGSETNNT